MALPPLPTALDRIGVAANAFIQGCQALVLSEQDDPAVKLQHFATRLIRIARSTHREHSISSAQYSVMALLQNEPLMSVVELARREGVAHPTMSHIISGLVKLGFVSRSLDPRDKRKSKLRLTPKGRELYNEIAERRVALFRALLAQISDTTAAEILEVIERIAPHLEKEMRTR